MYNNWLAVDNESVVTLFESETEADAKEQIERDGIPGVFVSRAEYDATLGETENKRDEKLRRLRAKLNNTSIIEMIKPECLTPKGEKALAITKKIKQLQKANATEVEAFNPDDV